MTSLLPAYDEQKLTPQPILALHYAFVRIAVLVASYRLAPLADYFLVEGKPSSSLFLVISAVSSATNGQKSFLTG
jgi:hypothetical protein